MPVENHDLRKADTDYTSRYMDHSQDNEEMVYPSRTSKRRRRLLDGLLHFINTSRTRVRESYALHTIYASKDPLNAEGTTLEAGVRDRGGSGNYYRRGRFHSKASKILFTVPVLAVTVLYAYARQVYRPLR